MSSSPTDTATLVDVTMPQMGVSVAEGTVVSWAKQVGDRVEADETICEISTDKIDTEVPAPVSGIVAEILVGVDTTVDVGVVLARIAADGGGAAATGAASPPAATAGAAGSTASALPSQATAAGSTASALPSPPTAAGSTVSALPSPPPAAPAPPRHDAPHSGASTGNGVPSESPRRYSPVVLRIAAEHGIDLSGVPGTGRGGRVRKQDVLAFVEAPPEAPLHIESPYRPEPAPSGGSGQLSRMRRQIGAHMKRSLETSAHCTTWIEADMTRVQAARARLGVTALPFVASAVVAALREHPQLNASLEGERYTQHADINLGIAVSLGEDGLIVPVIHRAHELSVEGLATRIRDLAQRARTRALTPDEVRGGTFTITNPGQYGTIMATPIISQPQVAILDLEAIVKRPVVVTDTEGNDSIAIRSMTILGMSWDHRALDGALAAQFLATVKRVVEGA